jgi:preprotein translocase subunit SecA
VIGGAVLHVGAIAEMKTGEGKTLVATLPSYLNALEGKGVHIATVNPYLAKRDAEWMGSIFKFLGLTVGLIQPEMRPEQRSPAYRSDITYGTATEFGFDYLRDNTARVKEHMVQTNHRFAIVDEVDSILIDEARTPLIISGPAEESAKWYRTFARVSPKLMRDDHYEVDEAKKTVAITEEGISKVEEILNVGNLYDEVHTPLIHYLETSLKAKELYRRDRDYVVQNREVLIVDEFTGRTLPGRRWQDGLHQAIEAREGVPIQQESQTYATITLQKYFQGYDKLSGMTGTAKTQATEFGNVYKLDVHEVPTNRPLIRADEPDVIYKSEDAKWKALSEDIKQRHEKGQPILVGTVSIEKSERVASYLKRTGIPHNVLNAKNHEKEAFFVAQAGRIGAVTVATNMAGRGVDILLGGNPEYLARQEMTAKGFNNDDYLLGLLSGEDAKRYEEIYEPILEQKKAECDAEHEKVVALGGLYVLGTERHESRRIDNQLRGRTGRQGDPGESRFYLSLEDDLLALFATDFISNFMDRMKMPDEIPIEAKMVSKAIERAQSQVESQNFEIRKNLLKYEEVMAKQRDIIYTLRSRVLLGEEVGEEGAKQTFSERARDYVADAVEGLLQTFINPEILPEEWDWDGFDTNLAQLYHSKLAEELDRSAISYEDILEAYLKEALSVYDDREAEIGEEEFASLERYVFLSVLDNRWREHLYELDQLKEGIGLRAYGQRDPLIEYQREAYDMFSGLMASIQDEFVRYMFHIETKKRRGDSSQEMVESHGSTDVIRAAAAGARPEQLSANTEEGVASRTPVRSDKTPRNAPCPCGSGKKYKKCHGVEV